MGLASLSASRPTAALHRRDQPVLSADLHALTRVVDHRHVGTGGLATKLRQRPSHVVEGAVSITLLTEKFSRTRDAPMSLASFCGLVDWAALRYAALPMTRATRFSARAGDYATSTSAKINTNNRTAHTAQVWQGRLALPMVTGG